jgi:GNAT superfamily N-acetyltransferase
MNLRPMVRGDLDAAIALLREAGLGGASGNLARYLAWQPACGWVADDDGELIGSVTVLRQGDVGFVGCMAVAAARRGTGLGRRLLEHAHAASGLTRFALEATPAGEPLYAKLGYVVTGESVIATRTSTGSATSAISDHAAVLALDRAASGLPRADMLTGLLAENGPGLLLPDGYGLVIGDRLGPVIAHNADTADTLIAALVAPCAVVTCPARALELMQSHGFTEARRLRRMYLGAPPSAPPDHIWALASPGAG